MTNGCGTEEMNDKNNMTSSALYDCNISSTQQMSALKAARAMFANTPPPASTNTG